MREGRTGAAMWPFVPVESDGRKSRGGGWKDTRGLQPAGRRVHVDQVHATDQRPSAGHDDALPSRFQCQPVGAGVDAERESVHDHRRFRPKDIQHNRGAGGADRLNRETAGPQGNVAICVLSRHRNTEQSCSCAAIAIL
jgi:hypothetical protein